MVNFYLSEWQRPRVVHEHQVFCWPAALPASPCSYSLCCSPKIEKYGPRVQESMTSVGLSLRRWPFSEFPAKTVCNKTWSVNAKQFFRWPNSLCFVVPRLEKRLQALDVVGRCPYTVRVGRDCFGVYPLEEGVELWLSFRPKVHNGEIQVCKVPQFSLRWRLNQHN